MLIYLRVWKVNPVGTGLIFFRNVQPKISLSHRGTVAHLRSEHWLTIKQQAMKVVCISLFQATFYINYMLQFVVSCTFEATRMLIRSCNIYNTIVTIFLKIDKSSLHGFENFIKCVQQYFQRYWLSPYTIALALLFVAAGSKINNVWSTVWVMLQSTMFHLWAARHNSKESHIS